MPIDAFPTEILLHIFEQGNCSTPFDADAGSALIIAVSQVCRTWRNVALDSATLWTDIHISSGSSLFKLDQLFARSKGLLVSVTADCRVPVKPLAHYWKLLKGVTEHSARVAALDVIAPLHVLSMLSRVVVGRKFPHLRRLHIVQAFRIHVGAEDEIKGRVPLWKMSIEAPDLRALSIDAITPTSHERFHLLKELQVKESEYFGCEIPVDHFLALHTLSITSSPIPSLLGCPSPADTQIVSLTLSDLRAIDIPRETLKQLLTTLRMPALEHLTIDGLAGYLWDEFIYWLADAQYPALRSVSLGSVSLACVDEPCLRAFASISALRLIHTDPGRIVRILEANPQICPRVRTIDCGINGRFRISTRR
jgi:hypothetical protein